MRPTAAMRPLTAIATGRPPPGRPRGSVPVSSAGTKPERGSTRRSCAAWSIRVWVVRGAGRGRPAPCRRAPGRGRSQSRRGRLAPAAAAEQGELAAQRGPSPPLELAHAEAVAAADRVEPVADAVEDRHPLPLRGRGPQQRATVEVGRELGCAPRGGSSAAGRSSRRACPRSGRGADRAASRTAGRGRGPGSCAGSRCGGRRRRGSRSRGRRQRRTGTAATVRVRLQPGAPAWPSSRSAKPSWSRWRW